MDVEYLRKPVPHLVFKNLFSKKVNEKMLEEVLDNEGNFKDALTGYTENIKSDIRTNKVLFLDDIYREKRSYSFFLVTIHPKLLILFNHDVLYLDLNHFQKRQ